MELLGVGSESKVPVGALDIRLELIPILTYDECGAGNNVGNGESPSALKEEVVMAQLASEKSRSTEKERLFLNYAKQWWREFLSLRPDHSERIVKVGGFDGR